MKPISHLDDNNSRIMGRYHDEGGEGAGGWRHRDQYR